MDPNPTQRHTPNIHLKCSHVWSQLTKSRHIISCVFSLHRSRTISSPLPINSGYQLTMCECVTEILGEHRGCLAGLSMALRCANVKECQCQCDRDTGSAGTWWTGWRLMSRSSPKVVDTPTTSKFEGAEDPHIVICLKKYFFMLRDAKTEGMLLLRLLEKLVCLSHATPDAS